MALALALSIFVEALVAQQRGGEGIFIPNSQKLAIKANRQYNPKLSDYTS